MDPKTDITNPTRIPPPRGYALSGKIMLTAVVFLFTIALLLLFIHLYLRWHVQRSHGRRRQRLDFAPVDDDRSAADVPPLGLDPKVLNSLPTLVMSSGDDVAECAVCLNELKDGEQVRVLHRCDHRFHVHCIDTWFGSHNSCPLCRSAADPPPPKAEAKAIAQSSGSGSGEVRIQIRSGEEPGLGSGSGSEGKGRMLAILRLLGRREVDPERGGGAGAVRASPPLPAE